MNITIHFLSGAVTRYKNVSEYLIKDNCVIIVCDSGTKYLVPFCAIKELVKHSD